MPKQLKPKDAAAMIGVSTKTLQRWRKLSLGPPYRRIGDGPRPTYRYEESAVRTFLDSRLIEPGAAKDLEG
jgi:DNA-binding transcriptional MerR regulator